ncbi:hypothetical protein BJ170DRAFT_680698 [Xylariales sp. AK1849]|nr:hypothetical protein BJ170DRAFT_680698 [Xylariales sp. AK1849]
MAPYLDDLGIGAITGPREETTEQAEPTDDCSICYSPMESKFVTLGCRHKFHPECLKTWCETAKHRAACPYCRDRLTYRCYHHLHSELLVPGAVISKDEIVKFCSDLCATQIGERVVTPVVDYDDMADEEGEIIVEMVADEGAYWYSALLLPNTFRAIYPLVQQLYHAHLAAEQAGSAGLHHPQRLFPDH